MKGTLVFGVDLQLFAFWKDVALLCWAVGVSGFVVWDRRNKVTQEAIVTLRHEVAKELADMRMNLESRRRHIDDSIELIRTRQADTPTRGDLADLYRAINNVSEVATELRGTVSALTNTIHMINQHLLAK